MYSNRRLKQSFHIGRGAYRPHPLDARHSRHIGSGYHIGGAIHHDRDKNLNIRAKIANLVAQKKAERKTPVDKLLSKAHSGKGLSLTSRNRQITTLLRKHADRKIVGFNICRKPIRKGNQIIINALTLGKLEDIRKDMDYADVFHLFLFIELDNEQTFMIEKNSVVDVEYTKMVPVGSTCIHRFVKPEHTVADMINRAERFNRNLYRYTAHSNNCQNFIMSLLKPMGYYNDKVKNFVYQDFTDLFTPVSSAISQGITDVSALFNRMIGKGLELPGNGLRTAGQDGGTKESSGTHGGALSLAGKKPRDILKGKPHTMPVKKPIKKDPLKKLKNKLLEQPQKRLIKVKPKPSMPKATNTAKKSGRGLKLKLNRDLAKHLTTELKKHAHLTKANINRIVANFKLHKDNLTLPQHATHLASQLIKHYHGYHKKSGSGMDKTKAVINAITSGMNAVDINKSDWSFVEKLFHPVSKGIMKVLQHLTRPSGSGKKKKSVSGFFKDIGGFLSKHRKDISKGVSVGSEVAAALATALGQPELAAPLMGLKKLSDVVGKV